MKVYLVGGAVRDSLLGLPVTERDWVVVGSTPQELEAAGYRRVGSDFPVFLHPLTREAYALARTERKSGKGHTGFECFFTPDVTLDEDLKRRDLTINAIAKDEDGNIYDPYEGVRDISDRSLRHVSSAFEEDPLRILRVARFACQLNELGFEVLEETLALMRDMVSRGDLSELTPERVWAEFSRVMMQSHPRVFFEVLARVGALTELIPELANELKLRACLEDLSAAVPLDDGIGVRLASFLRSLSPSSVDEFCNRYRVPKEYRQLSLMTASHWQTWKEVLNKQNSDVIQFLQHLDAFRRVNRFHDFLTACGVNVAEAGQINSFLRRAMEIASQVSSQDLQDKFDGKALGDALREKRIQALERARIRVTGKGATGKKNDGYN